MSPKAKKIFIITHIAVVAFIFIGSGIAKIAGGEQIIKMAVNFGIDPSTYRLLGIIEVLSTTLFIYQRISLLGTLLLVAYMGGGIATHLEHGQPAIVPVMIEVMIWVTAALRHPELRERLIKRKYEVI